PSMAEFLDTLRTFVESIELPSDPDLEAWVTEWQRRSQDEFVSVLRATCDEMLRFVGLLTPQNKTARLYEIYDRLGCFAPATKGSGTSTVAAALAVFVRHGRTFEHAVIEAINMLGSDTDTIAAMTATLAGAHAGYAAIPEKWATRMQDFSYFV